MTNIEPCEEFGLHAVGKHAEMVVHSAASTTGGGHLDERDRRDIARAAYWAADEGPAEVYAVVERILARLLATPPAQTTPGTRS